jgi:hypothetical protein
MTSTESINRIIKKCCDNFKNMGNFFFVKIYFQYVNTHTSVPDSTKIVPGQPISCRTLAVRGKYGYKYVPSSVKV